MPAVHTEALAGRGETCRWMSAAVGWGLRATGYWLVFSGESVTSETILRVDSDQFFLNNSRQVPAAWGGARSGMYDCVVVSGVLRQVESGRGR